MPDTRPFYSVQNKRPINPQRGFEYKQESRDRESEIRNRRNIELKLNVSYAF